jgi:hypothetical protein
VQLRNFLNVSAANFAATKLADRAFTWRTRIAKARLGLRRLHWRTVAAGQRRACGIVQRFQRNIPPIS